MASGDMNVQVPGRWDAFELAPDFVKERFDNGWNTALLAYGTTMTAIGKLFDIISNLKQISTTLNMDYTKISIDDIDLDYPVLDESKLEPRNVPSIPPDPQLIDTTMDTFPNFPDLTVGDIVNPNETYTSALLTALKAKFLSDLNTGGTGISAAVENDIFNRESERALIVHNDAMDEIAANAAAGGYPMPGGAVFAAHNKATVDFFNKRLDVSRDVSIKSFDLAFQHTQFVLQQGMNFELGIMNWAHSVATLAFNYATATIDAQVKVFSARTDGVSKHITGIIEKSRAKIEYNKGLIEAYLGKINAYAAAMRGESDRIGAVAKAYDTKVNLFRGVADFEIQKIGLDVKALELAMTKYIANANLAIKDKEVDIKQHELLNSIALDAAKAAAAAASQLVAGAMSGVHAQASVSSSAQAQYSVTGRWHWTEEDGWILD